MNTNLHDDQFEEFFKNKLNEFDDSPTSDMWDRIEGVIPPKPKPVILKYLTPISIAASFLLVVGLWAAVAQYRTQNQTLSKKLEEAEQKIETLTNKVEQRVNETIVLPQQEKKEGNSLKINPTIAESSVAESNETIVSNQSNQLDNPNNLLDKKPIIHPKKDLKDNQKKGKTSIKENIADNNLTVDENQKIKNAPQNNAPKRIEKPLEPTNNFKQNENKQVVDKNPTTPKIKTDPKKILAKQTINPLELKEMTAFKQDLATINKDKLVQPNLDNRSNKKNKIQPKGRFSVALTVQSVWEDRDFKRKGPPPREHKRPEIAKMGFEIGGRVNYEFNKNWSVSAGLTKRNERTILNIDKEINYSKDDENQQNVNNQLYEGTSSYGEVGINVALHRNPQFQPSNEFPVVLTLNGEQEKESLNIPIAVQYQRSFGKWSVGIRAGVSGQVVLDSKFRPKRITTNIPEITAEEVRLTNPPKLSEKFSVDGLIGLSIAYRLNDRWKLHFEPTEFKSFTDKHRSENGHVTSNTSGLQLGASYSF